MIRPFSAALPFAVGLAFIVGGCSAEAPPPPPPVDVTVVQVGKAAEPLVLSYSGRARGAREVEVRARVSGILVRRYYVEGARVAAGDLLFRIDPAPLAAQVQTARGELGVQAARAEEARRQLERIRTLHGRGFVSGTRLDQAEADYSAARAGSEAARGALDHARLNLSYTQVRAPISGITGMESRSEGSLIDASAAASSLLTTITQADRLYIDFAMPEAEAQRVRAAMRRGAVSVRLLETGSTAPLGTATISFVDARVNADTGTVDVRATFENGGSPLAPGQFVRVELIGLTTAEGTYVPARAITHGADGAFVWKIDRDSKAQMQPVTLGMPVGNMVRIDAGVTPGDRIVVEGVLKLQPGAAVRATPATDAK